MQQFLEVKKHYKRIKKKSDLALNALLDYILQNRNL